jgi:carbamoyl-phosphate synthase large subunit
MTERDSAISVLVTGVGAIIGQGIIGGLRRAGRSVRIVGLDRSDRSPGPFLCDAFHRKPDCAEDHAEYPSFWRRLLQQERIDLVLPGLEVDLYFVNSHRSLFVDLGVAVAVNCPELVALCTDKWQLGEALAATGLPRIPSSMPNSWTEAIDELGPPPLLLKPRRGNGLIGPLPSGRHHKRPAEDGFAGRRDPRGLHHHVGVGTAHDDNLRPLHACFLRQAPLTLRPR